MYSKIEDSNNYDRQNSKSITKCIDNIISWTSPEDADEVALSFKTEEAANEAWHMINIILGKEDNDLDCILEDPSPNTLIQIAEKINNAMYQLGKRNSVTQQLMKDKVNMLITIG